MPMPTYTLMRGLSSVLDIDNKICTKSEPKRYFDITKKNLFCYFVDFAAKICYKGISKKE